VVSDPELQNGREGQSVWAAASPSSNNRAPTISRLVSEETPQPSRMSPEYSIALSTSNASLHEESVRPRYLHSSDLDETPDSGNFAAAPDAPPGP
jgi:hypothetical protein